jgi:hypothetical protein
VTNILNKVRLITVFPRMVSKRPSKPAAQLPFTCIQPRSQSDRAAVSKLKAMLCRSPRTPATALLTQSTACAGDRLLSCRNLTSRMRRIPRRLEIWSTCSGNALVGAANPHLNASPPLERQAAFSRTSSTSATSSIGFAIQPTTDVFLPILQSPR